VLLADGTRVPYDGLIVATGVRPRRLPGEGAHVLRTLDDALALRDRLGPGRRLVVVGAGFLGAEAAAVAWRLGAEVTLLEPAPVPLAHAVGEQVGRVLSQAHLEHGVDLRTGVTVTEVTDEGVRLAGRRGSRPTRCWSRSARCRTPSGWPDSGLTVGDGVVCDEYCEAAKNVYAAGDVARWYNPLFGTSMRIEHRTNAAEQGMAAARNLLQLRGAQAVRAGAVLLVRPVRHEDPGLRLSARPRRSRRGGRGLGRAPVRGRLPHRRPAHRRPRGRHAAQGDPRLAAGHRGAERVGRRPLVHGATTV
jgi:NADPH-dependent 2,4-dienoyl-CoA reductase/sulfur reductase-like enzyme